MTSTKAKVIVTLPFSEGEYPGALRCPYKSSLAPSPGPFVQGFLQHSGTEKPGSS
jgi:hypothetical protein